jgi:hypothetical protein
VPPDDDDDQVQEAGYGHIEELSYTEGGSPGIVAIDAAAAQDVPPPIDEEAKWEEEGVREHLKMAGEGLHLAFGVAEKDWEMSKKDLDRMAGPLTRILNRYEPTARAAVVSDPILLGYGTTMYAYRSLLQRRAVRIAEREAAERGDVLEHRAGYTTPTIVPDSSDSDSEIPRPSPDRPARVPNPKGLRFPEAARSRQP